ARPVAGRGCGLGCPGLRRPLLRCCPAGAGREREVGVLLACAGEACRPRLGGPLGGSGRGRLARSRRARGCTVSGVGLGGWREPVLAVLARPSLWAVALRQARVLARPGWWRRRPFL